MSEEALLAEIALRTDRIWDLIQWWASITFGVLLAAHLGAKSLNKVFVTLIIIIYSLFSITLVQMFQFNVGAVIASLEALSTFPERDNISAVGKFVLDDPGYSRAMTLFFTLGITYIGTIFYVVYSYRSMSGRSVKDILETDGDT